METRAENNFLGNINIIRSPESPGFLLVEIIPDQRTPEIAIENVLVINNEEPKSAESDILQKIWKQKKWQIITTTNLQGLIRKNNERFIFPGKNDLADKERDIIVFLGNLSKNKDERRKIINELITRISQPVTWSKLEIETGGNIIEIFPRKIYFIGKESVFFIGKFRQDIATKIKIKYFNETEEKVRTEFIDLKNIKKTIPGEADLAKIWNDFSQGKRVGQEIKIGKLSFLNDYFPFVLIFIGSSLLVFGLKNRRKE